MRKLANMKRLPKTISRRGGTTLTEVLMSILCMGIGVVAVASLFPIALLRSVQGTQLTQATVLRFNAETLIDLYDAVPVSPAPAPASEFRNLVFNPDWDNDFGEHFNRNYLIDPLGAIIIRGDNGAPLDGSGMPPLYNNVGAMGRFDAMPIFFGQGYAYPPAAVEADAQSVVTLPDSYVTLGDEFPAAQEMVAAPSWVEIPPSSDLDLDEIDTIASGANAVRMILFNVDGTLSEVRFLNAASIDTASNATRINFNPPLPNNGQYSGTGSVSRIRIELRERRYTWMLTVRNDTPPSTVDPATAAARVDVVVFFRRAPSAEEEVPFILTNSGVRTYTLSPIPQQDWPYPTPYPSPYPEPFLKRSGFMLSTSTGTWHRLAAVDEGSLTIKIERGSPNLNGSHAVFMRGVVDVYPLGQKP